ncbi:hypothetical protein J3R83DRAFT_11653 [Lanmaoa asiatica]|nr:hypothetical protein J3R83DRAFT_11653 [Lanmaoa asiatica]
MSRERFPRQSAASSGGAATPSDVTTSSGGLGTTTSGLATATIETSALSTSGANKSLAPSSNPVGLTTTSSSTESTSTSQPASTSQSQSGSSVPSTSSLIPSSSSSIPPSTTSSTASSSSSVPPPTTTEPPIPSSSQQGTPTTITSSYTTYLNGSLILTQTAYPSTIPEPSGPTTSSNRAAIIGGAAAGGTALLILLLSLAFCARRKQFKRLRFLNAITLKRKQIHSRATLLDGEDLADVDLGRPARGYTDYEIPWDMRDSRDGSDRALMAGRGTPGTHLTRASQWSETGSAFKEDLWPPPTEGTRLMDPLANRDDLDIDLGRIVDDVMGPSSAAGHFSDRSVSSVYRDSVAVSEGVVHSRTVSNASNAALLEAAGLGGTSGVGPPSTAPVRSSPLAQPGTKPGSVERH